MTCGLLKTFEVIIAIGTGKKMRRSDWTGMSNRSGAFFITQVLLLKKTVLV